MENLTSRFTSFTQEKYSKEEVLPELFKFQKELVSFTFPDEMINDQLRIWDVEKYLTTVNENKGHIADEELRRFKASCKEVCNGIKEEVSGQKGENRAYNYLCNSKCKKVIIRNVELEDEGIRTEIDEIVITQKKIYIIEVKNTKKEIFIDEKGNYYRIGKYTNMESNILQRMNVRENLLRKILWKSGIEYFDIEKVIVFTDRYVKIHNECSGLKTLILYQVPSYIDKADGRYLYSTEDMEDMGYYINEEKEHQKYFLKIDIDSCKKSYEELMIKLDMPGFENKESDMMQVNESSLFKGVKNHLHQLVSEVIPNWFA